jgi:uncharacterized protein (TIGR03067 family)
MAIATLLLVAAATSAGDSAKKEMKQFEGMWTLASLQINGKPVAEPDLKKFKLTAVGELWNLSIDGKQYPAQYRVEPDRTPKEIDVTYLEGPNKGKTVHGIYEFDGNTLRLCRQIEPDKDRPTAFESKPGSGLVLVTWKR